MHGNLIIGWILFVGFGTKEMGKTLSSYSLLSSEHMQGHAGAAIAYGSLLLRGLFFEFMLLNKNKKCIHLYSLFKDRL